MGSLTLYLALLIRASKYNYPTYRTGKQERLRILRIQNILMVAALVGGLLLGSLTGSPGMTNTALTFAVLYAGEKYSEMHLERGWSGWLLVLGVSGFAYKLALWLHEHPEFLATVFKV